MDIQTKRNIIVAVVTALVVAQLQGSYFPGLYKDEANIGFLLECFVGFVVFWYMKGDWFLKLGGSLLAFLFSFIIFAFQSNLFLAFYSMKFFLPLVIGVTVGVGSWHLFEKLKTRNEKRN